MEFNNTKIIKCDNFLSDKQKIFIEEILLGNNFPYFVNKNSVSKDGIVFLSHILLRRPESRSNENEVNSVYYESIVEIINSFLNKNKLRADKFLRICLNLTFNNGYKQTEVHKDHDCDHRQILICLNDVDSKSDTIILDGKKKIKLSHKKYRGYCFDNKPHYNIIPLKGIRLMLVATFI
jgi:hypothetical protein